LIRRVSALVTAYRTKEESAALKAAIVKHYITTDATLYAVATQAGCDCGYARRALIAAGVLLDDTPSRASQHALARAERDQEILRLHQAGVSGNAIARQVGLDPQRITSILVDLGVKQRRSHRTDPSIPPMRTAEESAGLKAAIIDGFLHTTRSLEAITAELGCDKSYASCVLRGMVRPPHRLRPKPKPA
jgi:hypothetical protein